MTKSKAVKAAASSSPQSQSSATALVPVHTPSSQEPTFSQLYAALADKMHSVLLRSEQQPNGRYWTPKPMKAEIVGSYNVSDLVNVAMSDSRMKFVAGTIRLAVVPCPALADSVHRLLAKQQALPNGDPWTPKALLKALKSSATPLQLIASVRLHPSLRESGGIVTLLQQQQTLSLDETEGTSTRPTKRRREESAEDMADADSDILMAQLTKFQDSLDSISGTLASLLGRMTAAEYRGFNTTAITGDDTLRPPPHNHRNPPDDFPTTVNALHALAGQPLIAVEEFYGLQSEALSHQTRIAQVRRAYGIGRLVLV